MTSRPENSLDKSTCMFIKGFSTYVIITKFFCSDTYAYVPMSTNNVYLLSC